MTKKITLPATPSSAPLQINDTVRLEFMLEKDAFIAAARFHGVSEPISYQLMIQDEDEEFEVISGGEDDYFATKREAIDAAILIAAPSMVSPPEVPSPVMVDLPMAVLFANGYLNGEMNALDVETQRHWKIVSDYIRSIQMKIATGLGTLS